MNKLVYAAVRIRYADILGLSSKTCVSNS